MKNLLSLAIAALVFGCSPQPSMQFTGSNPSYKGVAARFPNLIPSISVDGQNRQPTDDVKVFWNQEAPPSNFKMVGMIASTHNPPDDINDQMVEFCKVIGLDAIVLQPPKTVRVVGIPKRMHIAFVFVRK